MKKVVLFMVGINVICAFAGLLLGNYGLAALNAVLAITNYYTSKQIV